jgi:hypothetical protein
MIKRCPKRTKRPAGALRKSRATPTPLLSTPCVMGGRDPSNILRTSKDGAKPALILHAGNAASMETSIHCNVISYLKQRESFKEGLG